MLPRRGGDDNLNGGPGYDLMDGGPGDHLLFDISDGPDRFEAGAGGDQDRIVCGPGEDDVAASRNAMVADDCERVRRLSAAQGPALLTSVTT